MDKFRSSKRSADQSGFMLVDVLVSTVIFVVGMLALAQLLIFTSHMHLSAQRSGEATRLAQDKLDELVKVNFATDPRIAITPANPDSLAVNVANYFDVPVAGVLTRRWKVQAGPTANTRLVTMRVVTSDRSQSARTMDIVTLLRQW
jgi:Tfp pilus assembly protein PilV